jgi:hypothetical protein
LNQVATEARRRQVNRKMEMEGKTTPVAGKIVSKESEDAEECNLSRR